MKKIILTVVLSALFIAPVFASEAGDMEILGKIGYTLDTDVKIYTESKDDYGSTDKGIVLGADFCFYINSQVAMGFGANNIFESKADYGMSDKYAFTNIYLSVRPKMDLDSDILDSFYFIAQAGYGFFRLNYDKNGVDDHFSTDNGPYWAVGVGVEIMYSFFLELMHSFNYGSVTVDGDRYDMKYSALLINVGYKFKFKP
jgi:hypothetical protein